MTDVHAVPGTDHVVDGVRLHVVVHGHADSGRVPVLLLHPLPATSYLWRDVQRDLASRIMTVAPDLAGCGRSERAPGRLDPARQARLLRDLLDVLEVERVVVAGHGVGGAVGVHLATVAPDRVAGLVLMSAPVHRDVWPPATALPLLLPGVRALAPEMLRVVPGLARALVGRAFGTDSSDATAPEQREVEAYLAPLRTPEGARGLRDVVAAVDMVGVEAAWDVLRAAPPPALVLWGEDDSTYRLPYGRRLVGELPGAAFVPVPGAGHLLPRERPERVAEELAAFVAER
ncbi:MAG: alpha/beta fold hydrolase [Actinomycetes bacterium]